MPRTSRSPRKGRSPTSPYKKRRNQRGGGVNSTLVDKFYTAPWDLTKSELSTLSNATPQEIVDNSEHVSKKTAADIIEFAQLKLRK